MLDRSESNEKPDADTRLGFGNLRAVPFIATRDGEYVGTTGLGPPLQHSLHVPK